MLNRRHSIFFAVQVLLWTGFALITRFVWISAHPPTWTWIIVYMALGLIFSSILYFGLRQLFTKPFFAQIIVTVLSVVVVGLVWRLVFNVLEYHVLESANNQFKFWGYFHNGKSAVIQLFAWSAGFWVLHYYHQFLQQQQQTDRANLEAQAATLKLLQYQINPHFLFNALGNLDTLLLKNQVAKGREMLGQLTNYLRTSLEEEPATSILLEKELQRAKDYLAIERVRFGDRLKVSWVVPETIPELMVPNAILQPLIENVFKHGKIATVAGGTLKVELVTGDDEVCLYLENERNEAKQDKGFGIGLKNTRQRLDQFYQGRAEFSIKADKEIYSVTLCLPYKMSALEDTNVFDAAYLKDK